MLVSVFVCVFFFNSIACLFVFVMPVFLFFLVLRLIWLDYFSCLFFLGAGVFLSCFFVESLILAQDERWRRA